MDLHVADFDENEVTSTLELQMRKKNEERRIVEEINNRTINTTRLWMEHIENLRNETEGYIALQQSESAHLASLERMLEREKAALGEELVRWVELKKQENQAKIRIAALKKRKEELLKKKNERLASCPIYALLQEEAELRRELNLPKNANKP